MPPVATAPKRRKASPTGAIINALDRFVFKHDDPAVRIRGYSAVDRRLTEAYSRQEVDLLNDIDLDGIMAAWRKRDERFDDAVKNIVHNPDMFKPGAQNDRLREHVTSGIELSQFERFLDTCVRLGTFSFCGTEGVDTILGLVDRINVDCTDNVLSTDPFLIEDDFDDSNPPHSETPLAGLADPVELRMPPRKHVKIGYAINRDLFCGGLAQRILNVINGPEGVAMKLNKRLAKHIVPLIFNAYYPGKNPWEFNMDGCGWETYYDDSGDGSDPWVNKICVAEDFDHCKYGMFCMVEESFDGINHPRTGDPMTCVGEYQIVSGGGRCLAEKFRNLLGLHRAEYCDKSNANGCQASIQFDRASRSGWGAFIWSRFMSRYLKDAYTELYGTGTTANFSRTEINQMTERTWVAGNTQAAFKLAVEWEREEVTLQGLNTYQYWNQEILWMKKWSEKWGLMVQNPWAVHLIQGLPDGKTCADLVE